MSEDAKGVGVLLSIVLLVAAFKFEHQLAKFFLDEDVKSVMVVHTKFPQNEITVPQFKNFLKQELTSIQRNNFINENKGKIVQWTGKVLDVKKRREYYVITLDNEYIPENDVSRAVSGVIRLYTGKNNSNRIDSVCGELSLYPLNLDDDLRISKFSVGDNFRYEAVIQGVNSKGCISAEYGVLSKDQSRLNDTGYKAGLIRDVSEAFDVAIKEVKQNLSASSLEASSQKNKPLNKIQLDCPQTKHLNYKTVLGNMTIDVLSDVPWDKKMIISLSGKRINELVKVSKCPDLWSSGSDFQYWFFYANEGGNACEGPYKLLSVGAGEFKVTNIDTCFGIDVLINKEAFKFDRHNVVFKEPNLGHAR